MGATRKKEKPYILIVGGQGSGKTKLARLVRAAVDLIEPGTAIRTTNDTRAAALVASEVE